jgi:adenylylsulfate kinase-like enzyme
MKNKILWFTGLSGAGKTTLANIISKKLKKKKFKVKKIDGDLFRKKNKIKKFDKREITNNNFSIIRYVSEIQYKYDYVIVSVISPLRKTRAFAFKKFGKDYFEILTKCKLKTLIDRDTKKLYEKAKKNIIKNLIGYNSKIKYEDTSYKKIIVKTDCETINESTNKILRKIL